MEHCGPWRIDGDQVVTARHEMVLRSLLPIFIGGADPEILSVDAQFLDSIQDRFDSLVQEISVSTTSFLERLEAIYGLVSSGTDLERRGRIIAAMRASGGISMAFFLQLATSIGYTVSIDRGVAPFRSGISRSGDSVREVNSYSIAAPPGWSTSSQGPWCPDVWIWTVHLTNLGANSDSMRLKSAFLALRPAATSIRWIEGSTTTLLGDS